MISSKQSFLSILLCFGFVLVHGQENILSSGNDASGSGGSSSYSIGQVDYIEASGSGGTTSQGVQQAYRIASVSISSIARSMEIELYPNPTHDRIQLSMSEVPEGLSYRLMDVSGKLLQESAVEQSKTLLDLHHHADGTYMLQLLIDQQSIQTFKVLKTR